MRERMSSPDGKRPRTAPPPRRLVEPDGRTQCGDKSRTGIICPRHSPPRLRQLQSDDYQSSGGSATNVSTALKYSIFTALRSTHRQLQRHAPAPLQDTSRNPMIRSKKEKVTGEILHLHQLPSHEMKFFDFLIRRLFD